MGYFVKTVKAGAVIEVYKYKYPTQKRTGAREDKANPTCAQQQDLNRDNAQAKLRWILNAYFHPGDFHLVQTYRRGVRPPPDQARRNNEQFLRLLRREFKKLGRELFYVSVTEYERAAIHHHIVIPACDVRMLASIWSHGRVHINPLDDTGQYGKLAEYLIKETDNTFRAGAAPYGKRWNASRNIKAPKPEVKKVKAGRWRETPIPLRGYYIETDSVRSGTNPFTGELWQRYTMVKPPVLPTRGGRKIRSMKKERAYGDCKDQN